MGNTPKFVFFVLFLLAFLLAGAILYAAGAHEYFLLMIGLAMLINGMSYIWKHEPKNSDQMIG